MKAAATLAATLTDVDRAALSATAPNNTFGIPQGKHSVDVTTRTTGTVRKGVDHKVCQVNQILTKDTLLFALECMSPASRRKFVAGIMDRQKNDTPLPRTHNTNAAVSLGMILGTCEQPRTGMTNRYTTTRIVPTLFDGSGV